MRGRWRVVRVRLRKSVKVERIEERLGFKENVMTEVETEAEATGRRSGAFNINIMYQQQYLVCQVPIHKLAS